MSGPSFKGLALFTPAGDCVYCRDLRKAAHWHLDLCAALQQQLGLNAPPYFLLPCFTATVDRWFDAHSQSLVTVAEAYPRVLPFETLLNTLFELGDLQWQPNYGNQEECCSQVIESYRADFPQLWQCHDLIMPIQPSADPEPTQPNRPENLEFSPQLYQFKLFVNGSDTLATEQMLRLLHRSLEAALSSPYSLELVDVLKHPEMAEAEHISATPTLIQVLPQPPRRLVGLFSSQSQIIQQLLGQD
ncbi:MAG: circadian clock KaiB family protein [Cyanobacteria bacterium REEB459]|nr:circadian clock KaiB family protein [Cyanobacteria bacterium REEB459]